MNFPRRIRGFAAGLVFTVLLAGPTFLLYGADETTRNKRAIPDIDVIERELESLTLKPDVRETAREKTDLSEDVSITPVGSIRASDSIEILRIRHWTEDSSPYGVSFFGAGLVSLALPTRDQSEEKTEDSGVVFVTVSIKPALSSDPNTLSYLSVAGAVLAFGLEPPTMGIRAGKVFMLNGGAADSTLSDWVDAGISYPVNEGFESDMPLDFMLRVDVERREWDLFFRQRLRYAGIRHAGSLERIWLKSAGSATTELFELAATADNPLFEDKDRDGIDDAVEIELGFSDQENDRGQLDELGEGTNLQHFISRRTHYASRRQVELEATLVEAIDAEGTGREVEDLAGRAIPEDQRRRHFTQEEFERERAEAQKRLTRFGRNQGSDETEDEGGEP